MDRFESRVALYLWLVGSGLMAALTAWMAQASEWVNGYGSFAWVLIGLLTAMICLICVLIGLKIRWMIGRNRAIMEWRQSAETVNPLDRSYTKKRVSLSSIADPVTNDIDGRTFTDCDLIGPCVVGIGDGCTIEGVAFVSCDIVAFKLNTPIFTAIKLTNSHIHGGKIMKSTILVPEHLVPQFEFEGANFITHKGPKYAQP